jgi:hypothetical protein
MQRRLFLTFATAALGGLLAASVNADVRPLRRRRIHRHVIRHRYRRVAAVRVVRGRPHWVVPVALAVGWELVHDHRVVVVKEIKTIERDGAKTEMAVVQDQHGKTEEVAILREDTAENRQELEGSELPDSDRP